MNKTEKLGDYCKNLNDLNAYLRKKGESHNYYKVYSRIERILPIIETGSLYLDTGKDWNDITDRELFNLKGAAFVNFAKCFSFSQSENVALWMLYGGIQKHGSMIDFPNKAMANILKTSSIELGYFDNGLFKKVQDLNRNDFDIYITDILYYAEETSGIYIKRSNETHKKVLKTVIDGLTVNKKVLAWSYENECRLIVTIKKTMVPNKCDTVRISLAGVDLGTSFSRVYRSPNFKGDAPEWVKPSRLSSTIDWDLCKGKSCCKATPDKCPVK